MNIYTTSTKNAISNLTRNEIAKLLACLFERALMNGEHFYIWNPAVSCYPQYAYIKLICFNKIVNLLLVKHDFEQL